MTKKFYIFLSSITAFRLIFAIILPVAPQEAYYWNYGRHPALSYFDHPPMAAYLIKLTTLLGVSSFTIHLAAIMMSVLMSLAIFKLTSNLFDIKTAFWTTVSINFTFIYALGGLIITPDVPMLLFWVLSMYACYEISQGNGAFWWILLGIFVGAGFISKYPMVFAGLGAFVFFISSKDRIKWFLTPWPYLSLIVAVIVALPVIIWNYQHDWASFMFQTSRRTGEMARYRPDFFFGFIGTIIGIYGIIPIPLLIAGIWNSVKEAFKEKSTAHWLIISFSLPLVLFLFPIALKSWVKMNWTVPAFIGWFMAGTYLIFKKYYTSKLLRSWGGFSLGFLIVTFFLAHILILLPSVHYGRGDYYVGWEQLSEEVSDVRAKMNDPYFICGYEYKLASELAFHLDDHPETVSNNIVGRNGLQYDYWCDPDTLVGYDAIFVYDERNSFKNPDELNNYFENVEPEGSVLIEKAGKKVTEFYIFRCLNYKGPGES